MHRDRMIGRLLFASGLALAVAGGLMLPAGANAQEARATLRGANGVVVGRARLEVEDGKVFVKATIRGMPPGFHGFHIHTIGICDAAGAFVSAGGHFNPGGSSHANHAGDQPALLVNANGTAWARFATDRYAIGDLFDADGSAFIVHAAADNYANIPAARYSAIAGGAVPDASTLATGDAGSRSACGVIAPA